MPPTTGAGRLTQRRRWDLGRALDLRCQHADLIDEAPRPVLSRLQRSDDRMPAGLRVRRGVAIGRVVAASNVPALQADAQVQPLLAGEKAVLTAVDRLGELSDSNVV